MYFDLYRIGAISSEFSPELLTSFSPLLQSCELSSNNVNNLALPNLSISWRFIEIYAEISYDYRC